MHLPVFTPQATSPSSIAQFGCEEDGGDPPIALLDVEKTSAQEKYLPGGGHAPHPHQPVTVANLVMMPSVMEQLGHEEEDANPMVVLAFDAETTIASSENVLFVNLLDIDERAAIATAGIAGRQTLTPCPPAVANLAAMPSAMASLGCKEDDVDQMVASTMGVNTTIASAKRVYYVAFLSVGEMAATAKAENVGVHPPTPLWLASTTMAAAPSVMARLGHKEDDSDPPQAPVNSGWSTLARVDNPVSERMLSACWLVLAPTVVATPSSGSRRHTKEDEGEPIALAFMWYATTISKWFPRELHSLATIATIAPLS